MNQFDMDDVGDGAAFAMDLAHKIRTEVHKAVRGQETAAWLFKASNDLASARILAQASQDENALYHCQQTAEKALKAFLTWHDTPFRKTHNLKELRDACVVLHPSLAAVTTQVDLLTDYAWKLRYPGDPYVVVPGE